MSKVGIVILNYNDCEETKKYVNSIKRFKSLNEIVVVDNKSTDSSYEELKLLENGNISVIQTNENKGYAYGNNAGVKYLKDRVDYIIISNPDITLKDSVIRKLKSDLDKNDDIALIAPVVKQHGEISRGWRLSRVIDEIGLNLNMIRRDILNLIGNFDESTFLFYEENILAAKLKNINKKVYVDNEVEITHNESVTINKTMASINKYKRLKDSQKYYVKYYLHANVFEMFILRFVYRISLIVAYIIYFFSNLFKKKK